MRLEAHPLIAFSAGYYIRSSQLRSQPAAASLYSGSCFRYRECS